MQFHYNPVQVYYTQMMSCSTLLKNHVVLMTASESMTSTSNLRGSLGRLADFRLASEVLPGTCLVPPQYLLHTFV